MQNAVLANDPLPCSAMLALPFDADLLEHVVFVLDPHPSKDRVFDLYRELAALDRSAVRATVLSTNGQLDDARCLKGFDLEFAYMKDARALGNSLQRVLAWRRRIRVLGADRLRIEVDGAKWPWRVAGLLAGVPVAKSSAGTSRFARDDAATRSAKASSAPRRFRHVVVVLKPDLARAMASARQALHTIGGLAEHGLRVTVVSELSSGRIEDLLASAGFGADRTGGRVDHVRIEEPRHATRTIGELRAVLERLRSDGADLLYFRQVRIASLVLAAARDLGFTVVLEAHEPYMTVAVQERAQLWKGDARANRHALTMARWDRRFDERTYREVDAVVCISRGMRRYVRRHSQVPTLLLRNGAPEPERFERRYVDEDRPLDVIYAGFAHLDKGVDVLIDAIASLPRVRLLIAGGPAEEDVAPFRARAERLGIADRVEFRLWMSQAELFRLMRGAKVGVHPLPGRGSKLWRTYTCPLKILEYMAQGTPVVATDLPAVREIVRSGWNGWLVQPKSAAALAAGIDRLLADPPFAGRLRDAALRHIRRSTHDRRADRLDRFLADVASGR